MWYASDMAHKKEALYSYGLSKDQEEVKFGDFDWSLIKEKRDAYVTRLNGIYENNLKREKVDFVYGFAQFLNENGDVEVTLLGNKNCHF